MTTPMTDHSTIMRNESLRSLIRSATYNIIGSGRVKAIPEEETPAQPFQGTQNEFPKIISQAEKAASVIGSPPVASESDDGVVTVELQMDTTDKARTIIELAKLKREGLITKDEFDKLKNELMEQNS